MELGSEDLSQKPPFANNPVQFEQTDPFGTEAPSARELNALNIVKNRIAVVLEGRPSSEEEDRLKEEALLNALDEIEALIRTTAQAANEQGTRSEIDVLRPSQEQRIEEAPNWLPGTQGHSGHSGEVLQSETDFTPVPVDPTGNEFAFQPADLAGVASWQPAETGLAGYSENLDMPVDVIRRLNSDSSSERLVGLSDLVRFGVEQAFLIIARAFDDQSEDVRDAAARALFDLQPDRIASFARTLREGSPDRRRRIGAALASSGLAAVAINNLAGQSREQGYEAFSLLFLMTKAGEVQPLVRAVEGHPNMEVRLAVVRLLALNGQAEILPSFRELAVRGVLPSEVRTAVIEAIYDLGRQIPREISSG